MADAVRFRKKVGSSGIIKHFNGKKTHVNGGDVVEIPRNNVLLIRKLIGDPPEHSTYECLDSEVADKIISAIPETEAEFEIRKQAAGSKYDVVNILSGVKINDAGLTKKQAEELLALNV